MGWLRGGNMKLIKNSTKRTVMFLAGLTLCVVAFLVGVACAYRIIRHGDIGTGAVAGLTSSLGSLAVAAGVAYLKRQGVFHVDGIGEDPSVSCPPPAEKEKATE